MPGDTASRVTPNNPRRPSGPVGPSERIDAIDALRGVALFGVLAINLVTEFRVSIFEQFLGPVRPVSPIDRAVESFLMVAVDMKAFALFSLLFGVGLAIQFERLAANPNRIRLLVRRLVILLAIGLLHLVLIWNGDILTEYALAGFVALPFLFGPRRLLPLAALVCLGLYPAMPWLVPNGVFPGAAAMIQDVAEANRIYGTGGFVEILAFRIRELPLIIPLHLYVFPRTVGLFLFGAWAWRSAVLKNPAAYGSLMLVVAVVGVSLGLALTLINANAFFTLRGANMVAGSLATIVLALGYAAAVIGACSTLAGKALFCWAAPLGRMAFTNYLAQSVIFGWIFYGYGLGLFGRLGASIALAIGLGVYLGQIIFSAWWLRRYRFGPVEWLWRTLMYGVAQPMALSMGRAG
jgi:uncharacterized protein